MAISVTTLLDKAQEYLPSDKVALVQEAYEVAEAGHRGQMRKSGSPYNRESVIMKDLTPISVRV